MLVSTNRSYHRVGLLPCNTITRTAWSVADGPEHLLLLQLALVRRARVWDEHALRWNYVRPGQEWDDGEVTSPTELEQCRNERELLRALQVRPNTAYANPAAYKKTIIELCKLISARCSHRHQLPTSHPSHV